MKAVLQIVHILINSSTIILHATGTFILLKLLPTSRTKPQRMYLINLSVVEAVYNVLELVRGMSDLFTDQKNPLVEEAMKYVHTTSWTGLSFIFYLAMMYIPLDRLAFVSLNIRYGRYWNAKKAKAHIGATWVFGVLVSLTMCVLVKTTEFEWIDVFFPYVYTTIDIMVVLTGIIFYIPFLQKKYN